MGESSRNAKVGRRGFMRRSGAAALAGASVGAVSGGVIGAVAGRRSASSLSAGRAAWEQSRGGPDAEATLQVTLPSSFANQLTEVTLEVMTPSGAFRQPAGLVELRPGENSVTVDLQYPFDDIVPGNYEYRAVFTAAGASSVDGAPAGGFRTADAITYQVTPFLWFS